MVSRRESLLGAFLLTSGVMGARPALADDGETAFQNTMRKLEQRHGAHGSDDERNVVLADVSRFVAAVSAG
jgi:hypothetical protein